MFSRVTGQQTYHTPCPQGTPTFAAARRQRRDLIIANPVEANTPTVAGQAVASASAPVNAGTVLLTDSDDRCTPPASTHRQIRTCPPRAKGPLDRRSKWFSLVTFFLQKKKVTRAGSTKRPIPRPQAQHLLAAGAAPPARAFLCLRRPHFFQQRKKWGKERRQKLRFCTSSARYTRQ